MRKTLLLLVFAIPAFGATKKHTPAKHVPTVAQLCWQFVQQTALLDLDKESRNTDSVSSLSRHLSLCEATLQADKFKSALALKLNELLLTLRDNNNLQDLRQALEQERQSQLVSSSEALQREQETTKAVIAAYNELQADYKKHLKGDVLLAERLRDSLPSAPQYEQQRGFFANVLQSMGEAAAAQASRPNIHCETEYVGNYAYTDCR